MLIPCHVQTTIAEQAKVSGSSCTPHKVFVILHLHYQLLTINTFYGTIALFGNKIDFNFKVEKCNWTIK